MFERVDCKKELDYIFLERMACMCLSKLPNIGKELEKLLD